MSGTRRAMADLLNEDFCPWANRYVYWLKKPLGILIVAALASLLCGLFVAPQGLVIAATIAVTIVLGMVWPWVGLRGLSCQLQFSGRRGLEGESSPVEIVVQNRWPFPVWGLAIEEGFFLEDEGEDATAVALSGIRGWSKTKFVWDFRPKCRGVYPTKLVRISTEFPFGVWKSSRDIDECEKLTVWPKTVCLEPALLSDGSNRSLLQHSDKRSGQEGDRIGVRAYREGDSLRLVHWAKTAKCGQLIVSERQGAAQSSVVIAIDTDPCIVHGTGPNSSFEHAIRIAASLCEQLAHQNVAVVMVANSDAWHVQPTELSRRRSLDRLAVITSAEPVDLAGYSSHEERFVITTSAARSARGSGWKTITLAPPDQAELDRGSVGERAENDWLHIDDATQPVAQFVRHWRRNVRQGWRGTQRKMGVAS